jgi:hypothetical protein
MRNRFLVLYLALAGLPLLGGCDVFVEDRNPDTVVVEDKTPDIVIEDKTPDAPPPPDINVTIEGGGKGDSGGDKGGESGGTAPSTPPASGG